MRQPTPPNQRKKIKTFSMVRGVRFEPTYGYLPEEIRMRGVSTAVLWGGAIFCLGILFYCLLVLGAMHSS